MFSMRKSRGAGLLPLGAWLMAQQAVDLTAEPSHLDFTGSQQ
jgi:hypothetical protein